MMQPDIPSPCIGICRIDKERQLCEGCLRTLDEIGCWGVMDAEQKLSVLQACLDRRQPNVAAARVAGDNDAEAS